MSNDSKTIFVTGGTGLVGSHAVEQALARGHRVRALVRPSSDTSWLDRWGVEKVLGDLEDAEALRRGVQGADWVFNCAAKVGDWGSLEEFRRLNVEALRLLLDAAAAAQVARFVHVSSLGVYEGRDHFGTDETTPPAVNSLDAYTRSKTEAEALALAYLGDLAPSPETLEKLPFVQEQLRQSTVTNPRLPVVVLRPGFIYGERDRTVLPKLITRLRSRVFAYFGSGNQVLNCIYVRNLVQAIFLAAEVPEAVGHVFNLTDGGRVTKHQFVGRVADLAGLTPPRRRIPRLAGLHTGRPDGAKGQAARIERATLDQQGPLQVPRPESGLFDRQGPPCAGLRAGLQHGTRARSRRRRSPGEGRVVATNRDRRGPMIGLRVLS